MKLAIAFTLLVLCLLCAYLAGIASNNRHLPAAVVFAAASATLGIAAASTLQHFLQ